ncbi:hypothetical protein EDC01DRAFT_629226 [Geopyxis carbonaria]|nr:hypothetical protein EDC01DRAFT_629226 [Geopyxis carbonaria]
MPTSPHCRDAFPAVYKIYEVYLLQRKLDDYAGLSLTSWSTKIGLTGFLEVIVIVARRHFAQWILTVVSMTGFVGYSTHAKLPMQITYVLHRSLSSHALPAYSLCCPLSIVLIFAFQGSQL